MTMYNWIILVVSILFTAFFIGLESAFAASEKLRPVPDKKAAPLPHHLLRLVASSPGHYKIAVLLGYTLSLVGLTISTSLLIGPPSGEWSQYGIASFLIHMLVVVSILFVFGFFLPKVFSGIFPNTLLALSALPLSLFYLLLFPLWLFILWCVKTAMVLITGKKRALQPGGKVFSKAGLSNLVLNEPLTQTDEMREEEKEVILFRNALDFSKVKLREIMIPRNEIEVLDIDSDIGALRQKFVETGFSRILFYEGNKDNIVGYVHTSAIFRKAQQIKPFLKNVLIVPETMAANRLLSRFIREHRSIALVVDEFGGTAGLVTSEDILEEIFGEIEDEHDTDDFTGKKINDMQYLLSGRFEIDALNEKYKLNIPESEHYETLAGFILYYLESIPAVNEIVTIGKLNFKILKATKTKIEMVYLTVSDV